VCDVHPDQEYPNMYLRSRRQLSPALARIGGVVFVVATIQYFVAQVVAASAWSPAYNWSKNVISDLGNTACGQFSVHGPTSYVCSPLHGVMNGAFVVAGILTIVGTVALWRLWPKRRVATAGLVFWVLSGIGKIVVGLVPENTNLTLHTIAATNLTLGSIGILLLSIAIHSEHPLLARFGRIVSLVGVVGGSLFITAQFVGASVTLGLGIGGIERVAGYPSNLWILVIGIVAIQRATGGRQTSIPVAKSTTFQG
jgi:hypothetical membrane protein